MRKVQELTIQWYEVLLAIDEQWTPNVEDIVQGSYEAAKLWVPSSGFNQDASMMDVMSYFMQSNLEDMRRPLRLYDMLHMCRSVRQTNSKVVFSTMSYLLAPRERILEFGQLCQRSRRPFADPRMPDLCLVPLATPFPKSFCRQVNIKS